MKQLQHPVTVRVVTMLTRGNLIVEEWQRNCEAARLRGAEPPDMPVLSEATSSKSSESAPSSFRHDSRPSSLHADVCRDCARRG